MRFIESYINDILNNCIEEKTDGFLKCNLTEKLELIYLYYRKDISELRKTYGWQVFKESQKIRNGIVHFKKSEMGYSGYTPDLFIEKSSLNELFLKEPMKKYMDEIIGFAKRIAEDLGLTLYLNCDVIGCPDNADSNYLFVSDKLL